MSAARTRKTAPKKVTKTAASPAAGTAALVAVLPGDMPLADPVAAALAAADPGLALRCVQTLEAGLAQTKGMVLVPVPHPLLSLARAFEAGASPDAALAQWADATRALMTALRRDRKRVVLMDAGALAAGHPGAFDILQARFELDPSAPTPAAAADGIPDPGLAPDPAALARAVLVLWADPEATELAETLAALQHGPVQPPRLARDGLDAVLAAPQDRADPDNVPDPADPAPAPDDPDPDDPAPDESEAEERQLLRDSLAELLGEVSRLEADRDALQALRDRQQDELADRHLLAALNDSLEKRLQARDADRRQREGVLGQVMLRDAQARGALEARVARLEAERDAATAELQAMQAELDRVYHSNSWKITAPIRAARRPLSKSDS